MTHQITTTPIVSLLCNVHDTDTVACHLGRVKRTGHGSALLPSAVCADPQYSRSLSVHNSFSIGVVGISGLLAELSIKSVYKNLISLRLAGQKVARVLRPRDVECPSSPTPANSPMHAIWEQICKPTSRHFREFLRCFVVISQHAQRWYCITEKRKTCPPKSVVSWPWFSQIHLRKNVEWDRIVKTAF